MRLLKRLLVMARRHWPTMGIAVIGILVAAALNLVTPYIIRDFTASLESPEALTFNVLIGFGIVLTCTYIVRAVARFISMAVSHLAAWRFVPEVTLAAYDKIQQLSMSFFQNKQTGELMSRILNDTRQLEILIAHAVPDLISNVAVVLGVAVMMFSINVRLTLITLIPVPFIIFAGTFYSKKVAPMYRLNQKVFGELNGALQDNLSGMREIQVFGQEGEEHKKMRSNCRYYSKVNIRANYANALFHPSIEVLTSMGTVIVIFFGGVLLMRGEMALSDVVGFLMYLSLFYSPLAVLARLVEDVQIAYAGGVRVFEILDAEPEIKEAANAVTVQGSKGRVAFENVAFRYNDKEEVLSDVSFVAESGKMLALVGPTGVGKTTIVSLIERFYDPNAGKITLDGVDIKDITIKSLRSQISTVLQDVFLFNGTVAENIAYGVMVGDDFDGRLFDDKGAVISEGVKEKVSSTLFEKRGDDVIIGSEKIRIPMERIIEAAKIARADSFISAMPDGYNTLIGERGVRLSGGQKQRLSIARAILRDTPILILDEATSAVDNETESEIQAAIESLASTRTIIIIAHRLSTVRRADNIIVLEHGKVAEHGKHEKLLADGGLYASLWANGAI